jgi:molybdenum cofactor guanylyltransferase
MTLQYKDITAVILAGGQGRRMGGQDKGLIEFNGRALIDILIEQLEQQSVDILINANRNQSRYQSSGYTVISDQLEDYQGPLAGFACAMAVAKTDYILTLPCDSPLLVANYVSRFIDSHTTKSAPVHVAFDGTRLQPVHALIKVELLSSLSEFLESGERKIDRWYARHDYVETDFSDCADMFRNINTPQDQRALLENQ